MFQVLNIFVCPEKGEKMDEVSRVLAIAGRGLEHDRYETSTGSYSDTKPGLRQATMFAHEALTAANLHPAVEIPFTPDDTRRNILVSGGPENLCDLAGKWIEIGDAVIAEFTEECTPCVRPSKLAKKPGYKEAFTENGRGGIRIAIRVGGEIKVGDEIRIREG